MTTPAPNDILELQPQRSFGGRQALAMDDVRRSARLWRLCLTLGWLDIKLRYRGSVLGPFWLTLSTAVMVGALGVLYSTLFRTNLHDYLPFLGLSLVLWGYISTLVGDACTCFTQSEAMIRSMRMPFALHAGRVTVRNLLVLAHNVVVIVVVYLIFQIWPGWRMLLALPGLAVWLADSVAICLLLGAFCARFRDIPPIVGSVMQIAFFVSPIIWKPEAVGPKMVWLPLNPFFSLLDVVRAPLLGGFPSWQIWASAGGYSLVVIIAAWLLFTRVRGRLAFWV